MSERVPVEHSKTRPKIDQNRIRVFSSSTDVKVGKNLVRTWVEFGKKMVPGKQGVTKGHFSPFLGLSESVFWGLFWGVFRGRVFCEI